MSVGASLLIFLLLASSEGSAKMADKQCLAYSIKREASNQPLRAQKGVVEVIRHRMKQKGLSCHQVVAEKHQFSWWHKNLKMNVEQDWLTKLDNMRTMPSVTPKCSTYFFSDDIKTPPWAKRMILARKEGNMKFLCDVQH